MVKLIAVDMDGTFLNSKREVSLESIKTIETIQNMGIQFVTNSGRDYAGVQYVLKDTGIVCEAICMNGAAVYDKEGNLVRAYYMKEKDVWNAIENINLDEFFVEFNTDKGICVLMKKEEAKERIRNWMALYNDGEYGNIEEEEIERDTKRLMESFIYINSVHDIFEKGYKVLKIALSHKDTQKISKIRESLSKNQNISVSSSFRTNIEITDKKANKGIALEEYAMNQGIKMEEVMAFGDSLNDYPMLSRNFGYTVAMKNAIDVIKKIAKYETETNDNDGVAKFIKEKIIDCEA